MNRLVQEKSPYLLQHKENPIYWFPWGEEALDKAKEENKLLFISIDIELVIGVMCQTYTLCKP